MSECSSAVSWTQTKSELTVVVQLPSGSRARDVTCTVASGRVAIGVSGVAQPLLEGELSNAVVGSVWSVEAEVLTLELEKQAPRYWRSAIVGGPEVDVAALLERDRREAQPAFVPPPDADATPQRVTDKETLRKLKAEFPQLSVPIGPAGDEHTVTHQNYNGPRRDFDWGPLPSTEDEPAHANEGGEVGGEGEGEGGGPGGSGAGGGSGGSGAGGGSGGSAPPAAGPYSWGAVPGPAPSAAAPAAPAATSSATPTPTPATQANKTQQPADAPGSMYQWGALPT
jgi:uncharacterized membrane protein YgcG